MAHNYEEKKDKLVFYTETNEIELVHGDDNPEYIAYWRNEFQFLEMLKSSPRLYEKIKELIKMDEDDFVDLSVASSGSEKFTNKTIHKTTKTSMEGK